MPTLYRDYRPQTFAEILGQNHIKITLQNEIAAGKIAQAFLFCGPRAVGKTTLARVLAKAVNCQTKGEHDFEPCDKCASCSAIVKGSSLDVVEIDAASNTGVDNVRENIIAFSRLAPSMSKYKVFIIDEVHMLSISAFNALLKIIEEPPSHVIFILCTTEIHKVPLTIISRCERFDFKRISVSDIVKKLTTIAAAEKINIDREVLEAVARRSGGHLRDAESLLGQIFSLGGKNIGLEQAELVMPHYNSSEAVDLIEYLSKKDAAKAIVLVNSLVDNGVNIKNFISELISLLRRIMLNKLSPSLSSDLGLDLGENLEMRLSQVAGNLTIEQMVTATRRFLDAYSDKNILIAQLPLEMAIAEMCFAPVVRSAANINSSRPTDYSTSSPRNNPSVNSQPSGGPAIINKDAPDDSIKNSPIRDLSQEEVLDKWPEFLVKIKKHNHSLSFVLQNCQPQEARAGQLSLIFKYKFHQDRINDIAIRGIVEKTLAEVYGGSLSFSSAIDENLEIRREEPAGPLTFATEAIVSDAADKANNGSGLLGDLLKTFGGEVIS